MAQESMCATLPFCPNTSIKEAHYWTSGIGRKSAVVPRAALLLPRRTGLAPEKTACIYISDSNSNYFPRISKSAFQF